MKAQGFSRSARLRKDSDFVAIKTDGKRRDGKYLSIKRLARPKNTTGPESPKPGRVAVVVAKRIGSAVIRNLWKRRIRAVFRQEDVLKESMDFMVVVRSAGRAPAYEALRAEILALVGK